MFEHLDDPTGGPTPALAAVQRRGRHLAARRSRTRLATGSAVLAATAGVTAVATVGLPSGRAGASSVGDGTTPGSSAAASTSDLAIPTASPTVAFPVPSAGAVSASPTGPVAATISTSPTGSAGNPTASPTPGAPAVSVSPVPTSTGPTTSPTPSGVAPARTTAPTDTAACDTERARLRTTLLGPDYAAADPGSNVVAWHHPAGPLTTLIVSVNCAAFSPDKISPDSREPVLEVSVQGFHSWLIGDSSSGHLELVWNADSGTEVEVTASFDPGIDPAIAKKELLRFGNRLID